MSWGRSSFQGSIDAKVKTTRRSLPLTSSFADPPIALKVSSIGSSSVLCYFGSENQWRGFPSSCFGCEWIDFDNSYKREDVLFESENGDVKMEISNGDNIISALFFVPVASL
ncbi:hypothetical protein Tco_0702897 [Tanacetum coccineum]|uniref:Uncharacterized protein n=1 Tax=Tanacetum coccineum TaxID=301880 RepID=A0ABQ4XY68_9ASTR